MVNKNMFKKAQSLPLNTIVIAILVIIVLLVIVVFFTTKVGESGETLNKQSVSKCSMTNPAIATIINKDTEKLDGTLNFCPNDGRLVPGVKGTTGKVCCIIPNK